MPTDTITNLDAIIDKWARDEFAKDAKYIDELKKYTKHDKDLTISPRMGNVTYTKHGETKFTKAKKEHGNEVGDNGAGNEDNDTTPKTLNQVVFKSTFNNCTDFVQNHAFRSERSTSITEKVTMTNGFKIGGNFGVQLGVPRIASATLSINPEVSLGNSTETSKTHALTWNSDSTLPVPARSRVIAEMVVKEEEYTGTFESKIMIKGLMEVDIKDQKGNKIHVVRSDLADIIRSSLLPEKRTNKKMSEDQQMATCEDLKVLDDNTAIWTVRGTCYFRYGVQQTINTRCEPLPQEHSGPCDSD